MSEEANLRVRENQTSEQIVVQIAFHRTTERFLHQTAPDFAVFVVCTEPTRETYVRRERLSRCPPDICGKDRTQAVKFLELLRLRKTSSKLEDGLTTRFLGDVAQEQAVVATIFQIRRKRPGRASAQLEFQAKIANNFLREQADQVRVARQICIVVPEDLL